MLYILLQFLHPSFMQCEDNQSHFVYKKEVSITEEYFARGKSLTWLRYVKWRQLEDWRKTDCWWIPIRFMINKWYITEAENYKYNSNLLFLLGKKKKSYFDIERWDTIFFLPFSWTNYHIAFAVTWVKNNVLPIFDLFSEKHLWKMSERNIRLSRCGWSYCYMNRRILVRTNILEEQEKLLSLKKK